MKTCIKAVGLVVVMIASTHAAWPQSGSRQTTQAPTSNRISAGVSAGHYRYDPGVAIEFTTRAIFQHHLSLRIRGGIQWSEAYKSAYDHWVSYRSFATALVYSGQVFESTRFYTELGLIGFVPDTRFSDDDFVEGFYEFNGLEITILSKPDYTICVYLGAGPAFINAHAEKIEGNPAYGNGLHFINGVRVYF